MTNKIKPHRLQNRLSQRQLARSAGISQAHVQRLESGVSCPTISLASRLCSALHATPCAVFPELASACSGLPLLDTSDPDHAYPTSSAADWLVTIFGANEFGVDYWVAENEARRIQRLLAHYNSATSEPRAEFLVFTTPSRVVAVNLCFIDRICLERGGPDDSFRMTRRHHHYTTEISVFLRDGLHFRALAFYVNDDERAAFSTNVPNLAHLGHTPFFVVTKGLRSSHLIRTDRIALIEMDPRLLDARGCCCTTDSEL